LRVEPPRITQWQKSHPLENDHRPLTLKPPSTRSILPVGAYDDKAWTVESVPQISCCARSGKAASCHEWTPSTPSTHPVDGHAAPTSITAR
jgi:hypothetical protein